MYLEKLYALNFKNYQEITLSLDPGINVFVGKNGSGKTNLLDAIYYLSLTKSAFSASDGHSIRHGETYFMIRGEFVKEGNRSDVALSFQQGAKKVFKENGRDYERLNAHIGKYPVVMINPDDTELVKEGSELRRKFFDGILAQTDSRYLDDLLGYHHALKQRNALLKMFYETGNKDLIALQVYDDVLIKTGNYIHQRRKDLMRLFHGFFQEFYSEIVQRNETTDIIYQSQLETENFKRGLTESRGKDLAIQRTSFGIHRDDFHFRLGTGDLKRLGSQGQQKSFVIALKLAQHKTIEESTGLKPLLLLDDIFDKLDDERIDRFVNLLKRGTGQVFITDARPHRTQDLLHNIGIKGKVFLVDQGMVNIERELI